MYSGLVESKGVVQSITDSNGNRELIISAPEILNDCKVGDSLAVNGVCLTVTQFTATVFYATAVPETLRKTNLGLLDVGSIVNLERCVQASTRIGGHYIQGHIDTTIKIIAIDIEAAAWNVTFQLPSEFKNYIVKKGFVALDGMSITVMDVGSDWFSVTFIPHTRAVTIVANYQIDTLVNLETDMMAKYIVNTVENFLIKKQEL